MSSDNTNIQSLTQQTGHLPSFSSFFNKGSPVPMNQLKIDAQSLMQSNNQLTTNDTFYDNSHVGRLPFNSNDQRDNNNIAVSSVNWLDFFKSHIEQLRTFSKDYIEYLENFVDKYDTDLLQKPLRTEFQKFMEDCRKNPEMSWSQEGFELVLSILKDVQSNEQQSVQNMNMDDFSEEATGTSEMSTSAPAEENGGNMDVQIQALTQSKRPTPIVLIDNKSNPLSIALSQFIAQGQPIVQGSDLADLYITNQPKRSRKHFTINCLKRGECSIIAGRNSQQREGFHVKWKGLLRYDPCNLFIFCQALTRDNRLQPSNVLAPEYANVKEPECSLSEEDYGGRRSTPDDLIIDSQCGCDPKTRSVLCPISINEYTDFSQAVKVRMFSLYQKNGRKSSTNGAQLCKSSKLRICVCRRTDKGQLERLTKFVDTRLITEKKSGQSDAVVTSKNVRKPKNIKTNKRNVGSRKNRSKRSVSNSNILHRGEQIDHSGEYGDTTPLSSNQIINSDQEG